MKLNLMDKSVVTQIISEMLLPDERDRKSDSFDSWQIYSGNQKKYVEAELQRTRPNSWTSYSISNISLCKIAVDKVSRSYAQQPNRELKDPNKSEMLSEIYKDAQAHVQLPYADALFNLHKYFVLWVDYNIEKEMYQFWALQPYEFSLVKDKKTGEVIAVILNYGNQQDFKARSFLGDGIDSLIADQQIDSSAETKIYAMWTAEQHVVVISQKKIIKTEQGEEIQFSVTYLKNPDNMTGINPLGVLPFVYVSKEPTVDYPTPSSLAYNSMLYNVLNSENLTAGNIQGTSIGVLSYPASLEGSFKNMTQGLTSLVKLPQSSNPNDRETKLEFKSPAPDLTGQRDNCLAYAKQVLAELGIQSSGVTGDMDSFSSALEKMLSEAPVQHLIEKNQNLYVDMEKQIFEIIKAYEALLGSNKFNEDDELVVRFQKPKLMISDNEVLTNLEKMLSLGLIEEWEKFKIIDPNLSDDQAKAKLAKINKEKQGKMVEFLNGGQGNQGNRSGSIPSAGGSPRPSEEGSSGDDNQRDPVERERGDESGNGA